MTPQQSLELQRLLSALCDGQLSHEEQQRLNDWLASDVECRRLYLEYVDMHARLLVHPQLAGSTPAVAPVRSTSQRSPIRVPQPLRYAIVATVTLAASL